MAFLTAMPTDVLGTLTEYISGKEIGRLVLSGNRLLMSQLRRQGAVNEIHLWQSPSSPVRFPNFKELFPFLRSLLIEFYDPDNNLYKGAHVSLVPTGLTKLSIRPLDAHKFFNDPETDSMQDLRACLPNLTSLEARVGSTDFRDWLKKAPESLIRLRMPDWLPNDALPSTLLELSVNTANKSDSPMVIVLPPNLETLGMGIDDFQHIDVLLAALPPTLTVLNLDTWRKVVLFSRHFSALPRGLLELNCDMDPSDTLPSSLAELPPGLTSITTSQLEAIHWSALPRSLHTLDLTSSRDRDHRRPKQVDFSTLPPRLSRFYAKIATTITTEAMREIPFIPHLRTLKLPETIVDPEAVALLPRTLKRLELKYMDVRHFRGIPPNIKILKISHIRLCPESVRLLPAPLEQLTGRLCISAHTISGMDLSVPENQDLPLSTYSHGALSDMPFESRPYAFELMELNKHLGKGDCKFPSVLSRIDLNGLEHLRDAFFEALPPSGTYLNFMDITLLTDHSMKFVGTFCDVLDVNQCTLLTGASFKYLPQNLRFLSFEKATEIYDEHIKDLPRGISYLQIANAKHLTNACGSFFPANIETVTITHNELITEAIVPTLPKGLVRHSAFRSFVVAKWVLSKGEVKYQDNTGGY